MEQGATEIEVIKIKSAFSEYKYEELNSFESLTLAQRQKKFKVSFLLYKKIIKKYLTIYIYDLFFLDKAIYFFLGGDAMINKCGNWIRKDNSKPKGREPDKLKKAGHSLGIFWYNRPFHKAFFFNLRKMTGSSNVIPAIEKEWKKSNDITMLYTAKELIDKGYRTIKNIKNDKDVIWNI